MVEGAGFPTMTSGKQQSFCAVSPMAGLKALFNLTALFRSTANITSRFPENAGINRLHFQKPIREVIFAPVLNLIKRKDGTYEVFIWNARNGAK